jgi:hypothetical protein
MVHINHIVDDVALADLLALELRLRREIAAVAVSEMVARCESGLIPALTRSSEKTELSFV